MKPIDNERRREMIESFCRSADEVLDGLHRDRIRYAVIITIPANVEYEEACKRLDQMAAIAKGM